MFEHFIAGYPIFQAGEPSAPPPLTSKRGYFEADVPQGFLQADLSAPHSPVDFS
jgi:hypothetical protein